MTASESWRVTTGPATVSAEFDASGESDAPVFVCAHGAGGNLADRGVVTSAAVLREAGFDTVRFNFPYREKKVARPDPMPTLTACIAAVVEHVRAAVGPRTIVIGGRSMGGRAASMLAAEGFACSGVLLLAYPLHPPGRPQQLRSAHLPQIPVPVLCVNGTRDDFCRRDLMDQVVATLPPTFRMYWIDGADHGFHVLKSSGRRDGDVMAEIGALARDWVATLR